MAALDAIYARIARSLDPGARLEKFRRLHGGISAETIALDLLDSSGAPRTVVLRRIGARIEAGDRLNASQQFSLLSELHAAGLPVPEPLLLDESRQLLADPYLLLGYLPGVSESAPADSLAFARALAQRLAEVHLRARSVTTVCPFLPSASDSVAELLANPPFACPPSFPQAAIREVLGRAWPLSQRNPDCLLHGDLHAGNLLWNDGALTGILDWADALVGDPLADVATTRLDLLWMLDDTPVQAFTCAYVAETACDVAQLPYWDLYACLRPRSNLAAWASVWPSQGRPELTEHTMSAARDSFATRALAALGKL